VPTVATKVASAAKQASKANNTQNSVIIEAKKAAAEATKPAAPAPKSTNATVTKK